MVAEKAVVEQTSAVLNIGFCRTMISKIKEYFHLYASGYWVVFVVTLLNNPATAAKLEIQ